MRRPAGKFSCVLGPAIVIAFRTHPFACAPMMLTRSTPEVLPEKLP